MYINALSKFDNNSVLLENTSSVAPHHLIASMSLVTGDCSPQPAATMAADWKRILSSVPI